jgi:hypothetical protein
MSSLETRIRVVMCGNCSIECGRTDDDVAACVEALQDECKELVANISIANYAS